MTTPPATVLVTLPLCTVPAVGLGHVFHTFVERWFLASGAPRAAEMLEPTPALRPA